MNLSRCYPASRYSRLSESSAEVTENDEPIKTDQTSVSSYLNTITFRPSAQALFSIIFAVGLSAGLAGYGIGIVVTLNRTNVSQQQGVSQGE